MSTYQLQTAGKAPRTIGPEAPQITVGRAATNDWIIEDVSLSRQHARFEWLPTGLQVRDLGSRFGTSLNGKAILEPGLVRPGDQLILGNVLVQVLDLGGTEVRIDPEAPTDLGLVAFTMPAAAVRSGEGAGPEGGPWAQAIAFIHEFTLGLIGAVTPQELLENLLEKLLKYLKADRGVVLLRGPQGELRPEADRIRGSRGPAQPIRLSQTLVEAALDRREALLLTDPMDDPALGSRSLIQSGVTTAIVIPLEAEGQVTGLLYFDSRSLLRRFTRDDLQLAATLAHVAAAKIQGARLLAEAQRTRALEQEMGIARDIQLRMLPRNSLGGGPVDLYAELRAAREVGGDLFDYQWQQGRLWFCIGDVAGKGVPAALVMALTKTLFRAHAAFSADPARLMAAVNAQLYQETGPGIFVSAFCGCLDPGDGRLLFSNGGHEPPLVVAPGGPARFLDTVPGLALGILPEFAFQLRETRLEPGGTLLLYTDGVTEALDPVGELFTPDRLRAELDRAPAGPAMGVVGHLLDAVDRFAAGAAQADDVTLMCLRLL